MGWRVDRDGDLTHHPPADHAMHSRAKCVSHAPRHCRCPITEIMDDEFVDIEIAGPPCPPWSKMGKHRGTSDERFRVHQVWILMVRRRRPRIIIFENVDTYPVALLFQSLGDLYEVRVCKVTPQNFGFAMNRLRVFAIMTLRSTMRWSVEMPLERLLLDLAASVVMTGKDYFVDQDADSYRVLLPAERRHLAQYEALCDSHRLRHAEVWDLHQSTKRPRDQCEEVHCPHISGRVAHCICGHAVSSCLHCRHCAAWVSRHTRRIARHVICLSWISTPSASDMWRDWV